MHHPQAEVQKERSMHLSWAVDLSRGSYDIAVVSILEPGTSWQVTTCVLFSFCKLGLINSAFFRVVVKSLSLQLSSFDLTWVKQLLEPKFHVLEIKHRTADDTHTCAHGHTCAMHASPCSHRQLATGILIAITHLGIKDKLETKSAEFLV